MKKKILLAILLCIGMILIFSSCESIPGFIQDILPTEETPSEGLEFKLNSDEKSYSVISIGTCTDEKIIIPSIYEGLPVTVIGCEAFASCENITSITIPESIISIENMAFSNCTALIEINYNAIECDDFSYYNDVFSNAGQNGDGIRVTIGAKVEKIPAHLFYSYYSSNSPQITEVVFEEGSVCESIENLAFYHCTYLTSIAIPDSVTSIGNLAFGYCPSLTSITIGKGITSIDGSMFFSCTGLQIITVNIGNTIYHSKDNCLIETATNTLILGCSYSTIPSYITSIGDFAFYYCRDLTSITIPDSVTTIGYYAFGDCTSLTSITIPSSVTSIGDDAFFGCSKLETITVNTGNTVYHSKDNCLIETATNTLIRGCSNSTMPSYITSIGNGTFSGCSNLTSLSIPDSVTSIGDYAFGDCTSLTSITIGSGVTSIGSSAFYNCTALTTINYTVTEEQWNAISKGYDWDFNTGNYTIYYNCSD